MFFEISLRNCFKQFKTQREHRQSPIELAEEQRQKVSQRKRTLDHQLNFSTFLWLHTSQRWAHTGSIANSEFIKRFHSNLLTSPSMWFSIPKQHLENLVNKYLLKKLSSSPINQICCESPLIRLRPARCLSGGVASELGLARVVLASADDLWPHFRAVVRQ